ncbi:surface rod structure-forming protein G [Micromonospora sp. Llam0]|uniref:G5 domain-containing protein n=1 Tax=Micromonospora sp. Llam0 TaxID=2485143 RepID=UPI000FC06A49|nr:G5 domain-containing protein [Micromonospora sp. Llam0]ROO52226.1 surface rod structure-forming protein G [Micromonospora sp. Llam0]
MTYPARDINQRPLPTTGAGRLGPGQKAAAYLGVGLAVFVLLCGGGSFLAGLVSSEPQATGDNLTALSGSGADGDRSAPPTSAVARGSASASPTASPTPTPTAAAPSVAQPKVETKTVTETREIPFKEKRVDDPSLAKGKTKVKTAGVTGVKTLTYRVTYTDGVQTAKELVSEKVAKKPVTKVVLVGTKVAQQCHPSYTGACVPFASDVDCAGGSGNGPAYVRGPVRVVGQDVYGLDRDGDGVACE